MSKLLVVVGATGKQGGSVIKSILSDSSASSQFKIRGITRDPSKPAAKALESQGVETVAGDIDDKASLVKAFQGAYAVFAVTDYWASMDMKKEIQQGKNMADAAKEAGVQHYIWSNLLNTTKSTNGDLSKIYHFDGKAEIGDYVKEIGLPYTYFLPGFYASNLPGGMIRKNDQTGKYILALPSKPDAQIPIIDIEADTGKFVKAILLDRESNLGKSIFAAENYYTPQQIIDGFKAAYPKAGEGMSYFEMPDDMFLRAMKGMGMPDHGAEEMLQNMKLLNPEYGYYGGASLDESKAIVKEPLTPWGEFVKNAPAFKDLN